MDRLVGQCQDRASMTRPANPHALEALRAVAEALDAQGVALCLLGPDDRTLLWNRSFLAFFPEHDGHVHAGEPYAENLRRFYAARLGETDAATVEQCIAEGIQRHRTQAQPFAFEHHGRWLRVASLPVPGLGRLRVWCALPAAPAEGDGEARPPEPAGDGWALSDPAGRINRANAGLAQLFALPSAGAAQGLTLDALLRHAWHGGDAAALERVRLTLAEGERFIGVPFELELPGGRWLRVLQQRTADGGAVSSFADITVPKRMQAELAAAREAAEAASRAKDSLLATVSHELRTPLNALQGLLGYLEEDGLGAEARRRLALAREAAGGMLALVEDILRFSEQEVRGVALEEAPTDLHALVEGVRELMAPRAAAQGLSLRTHVAHDLPPALWLDGTRLRQVLLNLVGNALKFTARGGVFVTAARQGGALVVEVEDTGAGIAPEALSRIFEPFAQADPADGRRHGGCGLGLAISRGILQAMGGSIGAESWPGQGSRFIIRLPCRQAGPPPRPAAASPARLDGLRVLVVDDQPLNREVARLHLAALGAEVSTAAGGDAAIGAGAAQDVVLMDLDMPGLDGFAAARALRGAGGGLCILALTAHAEGGYRARAAAAGLDGFITKPVTAAQLSAGILGALLDTEVAAPLRAAMDGAGWAALLEELGRTADEALDELAAGGPPLAAAHRLKGVAWNLGARRLGDRAATLEAAPPEEVAAALPALRRLAAASRAALACLPGAPGSDAGATAVLRLPATAGA
ncbi:ATP-binding protein [Roseococcus sp. DSY-14]|uniref:hybrid sensor histidine kinase/response regulator n=1 Tax=Roseococcus sp. DSY-14 TaxID=3369650 RepID=UPI00387B2565